MGKLNREAKERLKVELNRVANEMMLEEDQDKFESLVISIQIFLSS